MFTIMLEARAGRKVQVVEHLPSKLYALSSNPSTTKKYKRILSVGWQEWLIRVPVLQV
jgi:hypothetical protein